MKQVTIENKTFGLYLSEQAILAEISQIAEEINLKYADSTPLFVSILNGSFMFTSDLMKKIEIPCELSFLKISSYDGTISTGKAKQLIGINESIEGRDILIIEDIIDTGFTMESIVNQLQKLQPKSIRIITLLFKPDSLQVNIEPDYVCFSIPEKFVVGYGLDLNGLGRNLPDIYQLI